MKWLKKHKYEIISGVQFMLVLFTMTMGFWFLYLLALVNVGLPMEWWLAITVVLALLSTGGLCQWIYMRGVEE